jgi:transposase
VSEALKPHRQKVRVFFTDEARFGQQGTLTNKWARKGSRPTAVKQTRYEWVYLYAAVEPASGEAVALLMPVVNIATFETFLQELSAKLQPDEHAVLIMDQAGWHTSKRVTVPENITVLLLPPYSPELNPVENLWHYIKSHYLSNRAYEDYEALLDAGQAAWRSLTPAIIRSVCRCDYLTHEIQP